MLARRRATNELRAQLDLSRLQFILSGAEPIRAETMAAFFRAFGPCGLRPSVFCSAYGLAEHVCGATAWGTNQLTVDRRWLEAARRVRPSAGGADARTLVSCGAPMAGVELAIADPETCARVGDGGVGEVWLRSPCVTAGYYGRAELSAAVFQVSLGGVLRFCTAQSIVFAAATPVCTGGSIARFFAILGLRCACADKGYKGDIMEYAMAKS